MLTWISSRRVWLVAGSGLLVAAAAGAWGWSSRRGPAPDPTGLPAELSRDNLKAQSADPEKLRDTMRETMQRTDLTEEQRREVMRRMREIREAELDKHIKEYMDAPADQKNAILDKHLAEMQKRMKEEQARRQQERAQRPPTTQPSQHRPDFASMSQQERKTRAESRNPDQTARHMAYFSALRARATARGIQMPFGGGPGDGGPGRGGRQRP